MESYSIMKGLTACIKKCICNKNIFVKRLNKANFYNDIKESKKCQLNLTLYFEYNMRLHKQTTSILWQIKKAQRRIWQCTAQYTAVIGHLTQINI